MRSTALSVAIAALLGMAVPSIADRATPARVALPEGDAQRPPGRADERGRAARRPGAPRGAHRNACGSTTRGPASTRSPRRSRSTSMTRRVCRASAVDAEVREEPLGLPLLLAAAEYADGRRGHRDQRGRRAVRSRDGRGPRPAGAVQRRASAVALQAAGQHARPDVRAADPRRPRQPRHLLPRGRPDRLRRQGQPLPVDGRRHEPVLLRRLHPDRRARQPQPRVRRAAHGRQHERPARQDPAHPRQRTTAATTSRAATCSAAARRKTRPEIYAMGFRNPFRFAVNEQGPRLRRRLLA